MYYFVDSGLQFTGPHSANAGKIVLDHCVFPILDIFTHSGDIRDEIRGLCKIDPKFSDGKIFRGGPSNFWTRIKKLTHILITVQSFAAIGRRARRSFSDLKNITSKT